MGAGQIGVVGWLGCSIGMVTHGGAGKHIYDLTYQEFYWFFRVGSPFFGPLGGEKKNIQKCIVRMTNVHVVGE